MKTTQHTPGPWTITGQETSRYDCTIRSVGCGKELWIADAAKTDAQLISAAPELLDACKMALEFVVATHGSENDGDIQEQLRQAIAKAEGK